MMHINKIIWLAEHPARADTSALGAINDSVGKFCTDNWTERKRYQLMVQNKLLSTIQAYSLGFLDRKPHALETLLPVLLVPRISFHRRLLGSTGLYQISQQSHKSAPTAGRIILLMFLIASTTHYHL